MTAVSSLLKSASSVRDQLATYQDEVEAFNYGNSAYTDSALSDYTAYLNSRITALNASGSISDASKALSLSKALDSATKSNISATITRENIQMMSGNASLTDKYNTIVDQYSRATANGDMTLAQSLMSQAYSVNQSIQLQQQTAADAQTTLATATATAAKADASAEGSVATVLTASLEQLNNDIKSTGMGDFNKTVQAWTTTNAKTLESLGVKLPNQPNYFDVVQGIAGAQYNAHMLASQMYAPYGSGPGSDSWNQAQDANDINSGTAKLPTLAGSISLQTVMQASADPSQYVFNPSKGAFVPTQQTGNTEQFTPLFDAKGKPIAGATPGTPTVEPTYSGTVAHTVVLTPTQTTQMQKLGLNFGSTTKGNAADGVQVQATAKTPVWLQQVLGKDGVTNMYTSQNGLQFTYDSSDGSGKSVYTIVSDTQGHLGLFEEGSTTEGYLHGEYGFNPNGGLTSDTSGGKSGGSLFGRLAGDVSTTLMGHASADAILGNGTNNFAPPPIPAQQNLQLPSINFATPPPLPTITPAAPKSTQPVIPQTVSIQGGSPNIQGSNTGGINNSGGKGIAITGVTNAPVGMSI